VANTHASGLTSREASLCRARTNAGSLGIGTVRRSDQSPTPASAPTSRRQSAPVPQQSNWRVVTDELSGAGLRPPVPSPAAGPGRVAARFGLSPAAPGRQACLVAWQGEVVDGAAAPDSQEADVAATLMVVSNPQRLLSDTPRDSGSHRVASWPGIRGRGEPARSTWRPTGRRLTVSRSPGLRFSEHARRV
jgi:hypothetical protein